MDLGTAVVTLAVGAIAVLPRVPALTEAGRAQAAIRRDIELWSALPAGTARDRLGTHIEERTVALLDERQRDKRVETGWLVGTGFAGVGWVLMLASTAMSSTESWVGQLRLVVQLAGLGAGAVAFFIIALTAALVVWRAGVKVRTHVRSRRMPPAPVPTRDRPRQAAAGRAVP